MSHHFDTPTAREDPRINVCDFYLFGGRPGSTVMAMTVNPDAGKAAPDTFREEGLYAFRFDLDGDGREEVAFKLRFGAVLHAKGPNHAHRQSFEVLRASGPGACAGADGELIITGETGRTAATDAGVKAFAGLAPDLFAGDAKALGAFRDALFKEGRFHPQAFENRQNFFAGRNVSAIVLEVPSSMIGEGRVGGWATASLHGHAPEVQVSRWGLPLITNIFMPDPEMREAFNRAAPADDLARFVPAGADVAAKLTRLAGTATDPAAYGRALAERLCPVMLPYELGSAAAFTAERINGRALADDVMDVILTLATNMPLGDGVAPDASRIAEAFPYFGEAYARAAQG
jgi:uncharacterized protein DUF4331